MRRASEWLRYRGGSLFAQMEALAAREKSPVVPICAALEAQIADPSDEDKQVFLADMALEEPGLNRLIAN